MPCEVLIATGGDDQALGVMKVLLESRRSEQELAATVKSSTMLANAHSSAIKVNTPVCRKGLKRLTWHLF